MVSDSRSEYPAAFIGIRRLHEYLDAQSAIRAAFIGSANIPFDVQSAPVGRDAAVVGLRAALDLNASVAIYASYTGAFNASSNAQTVSAGVRFVW